MAYTVNTFRPEFMEQVIQLYRAINEVQPEVIYWWPGEEAYMWESCFCVFAGDDLVAKGQVRPINVQSAGSDPNACHTIYVNLKVHPEWEHDKALKDLLFDKLYERALVQKSKLPSEYGTKLCVGNIATEETNSAYFLEKGFVHFNSLFWMERGLEAPVEDALALPENLVVEKWAMESEAEEQRYLAAERRIWPNHALGLQRLQEYKSSPHWTAITAFAEGEIVGSAMAWEQDPSTKSGEIEDVFVMPEWRQKGIARYLLTQGIRHLQEAGLDKAFLLVLTDNESALNLYRSVGFQAVKEERRFHIELR